MRRSGYDGDPNPTRANPRAAVDTGELPVPQPDPIECDYKPPSEREAIAKFKESTNGLAKYTASTGGGNLEGDLIAVSFSGEVYDLRLRRRPSSAAARCAHKARGTARRHHGGNPLGVGRNDLGCAVRGRSQNRWPDRSAGAAWQQQSRLAIASSKPTSPPGGELRPSQGEVLPCRRRHTPPGVRPKDREVARHRAIAVALDHIQGVVVGKRLYYIGGLRQFPQPAVDTVYIYDPATDRFSRGASMPRPRGAGGVAAYGGKIYYAGGLHDGEAVPWLDVYDPASDTWLQLRDMPRARDHFQAVVVSGKLYAIGGRDGRQGREIAENDAYTIASGNWQSDLAPLPTLRGGYAAAALGRSIYVIGGETLSTALNTVEAYDTRSDTWRTLEPVPTGRHGIEAAVCNGGLYIAAGGLLAGAHAPTDLFDVYFPRARSACYGRQPSGSSDFALTFLHGVELTKPTSLQFGPGQAVVRLPAERLDQGLHGRASRSGRLHGDGDADDPPDSGHPESRRRRVVGFRFSRGWSP